MNPVFGQLVIGPAGSGKSTYCEVMGNYLSELGRRVILVNIDPANDVLPYKPSVDISQLITVNDVMQSMKLGPNGALLYCMDFLDINFDWLLKQLQNAINCANSEDNKCPYLLIDSPGQIELFTNHNSLKNILNKLNSLSKHNRKSSESSDESKLIKSNIDMRLVTVNIVDSHYANDASKFISVALNCLNSMVHLEMPHINVLSKIDLIQKYGKTDFGLDFYCDLLDLNHLVDRISDDPFLAKFKKLTKSLAGVIEDYSLVSFIPLDINNAKTVIKLLRSIDRANGFYMTDLNTSEQIENFYRSSESADFENSKYEELLEKVLD
jgi:GTPase SAR1 family protein